VVTLTDFDPFASAPADEPTAPAQPQVNIPAAPVDAPRPVQVPGDPEAGTTTCKAGGG